jgi:chorismate synthase
MRVAAGGIARKYLRERLGIEIFGYLSAIGPLDLAPVDPPSAYDNPFFCPDPSRIAELEQLMWDVRKAGDSLGARVTVVARGVPPGLGEPVFDRLDADLAHAMMSINAVKGVEIGDGFAAAALSGEDNADEMRMRQDGTVEFLANHAGGILGGISTGQPIVARMAVKPTSSILTPRQAVTRSGDNTEILTKGRHDPCVGIRAVPVAEAMLACVLADHLLRHRAQNPQAALQGMLPIA